MTLSQALVLGVLQGVTEFLPVSSSGHLALAQHALPGAREPELLFTVIVHLGTLAAIAWVLRERLLALGREALSLVGIVAPGPSSAVDRRWLLLILVATLWTGGIGLVLADGVRAVNARPAWVGVALLGTALVLLIPERIGTRMRGAETLDLRDALAVGIAQGIGLVPGISRSGITIATALWRDVQGPIAVEFSILVSVPAVLGANAMQLLSAGSATLSAQAAPLTVGFLAALVSGIGSLKLLQWIVARRRLLPFAAYCAVVGSGAILLG